MTWIKIIGQCLLVVLPGTGAVMITKNKNHLCLKLQVTGHQMSCRHTKLCVTQDNTECLGSSGWTAVSTFQLLDATVSRLTLARHFKYFYALQSC